MIDYDGIVHIKNFLNKQEVINLNNEIDEIYNSFSINGVSRNSIWINRNLCEINSPIVNIRKTNLLEIALKIIQKTFPKSLNEMKLSRVRIIIEKNNSHPLTWHTDQAKGIKRALIYLKGGNLNDGNLEYIKSSHLVQYNSGIHKIDVKKENFTNKILSFDTKEGDMIIFDINGIHKKNPVYKERRVLFFEFHNGISDKKINKVIFDNTKITSLIKNNIDFLFPKNVNLIDNSPLYEEKIPEDTPIKVFIFYFKTFYKIFINKIKKKLLKIF